MVNRKTVELIDFLFRVAEIAAALSTGYHLAVLDMTLPNWTEKWWIRDIGPFDISGTLLILILLLDVAYGRFVIWRKNYE